ARKPAEAPLPDVMISSAGPSPDSIGTTALIWVSETYSSVAAWPPIDTRTPPSTAGRRPELSKLPAAGVASPICGPLDRDHLAGHNPAREETSRGGLGPGGSLRKLVTPNSGA